jgi:hypothetical protein
VVAPILTIIALTLVRLQGQQARVSGDDGDAEGRGTALYDGGDQGGYDNPGYRVGADADEQFPHVRVGGHWSECLHEDLQGEKDETEAEDGEPDVMADAGPPAAPRARYEHHQGADADEPDGVVVDLEGDNLHGKRGADISAEYDAHRLAEPHETGAHESDKHDGRGRRALKERGYGRAHAHALEPVARGGKKKSPEARARGPLQAVARELHAVEHKHHAAEKAEYRYGNHEIIRKDGRMTEGAFTLYHHRRKTPGS